LNVEVVRLRADTAPPLGVGAQAIEIGRHLADGDLRKTAESAASHDSPEPGQHKRDMLRGVDVSAFVWCMPQMLLEIIEMVLEQLPQFGLMRGDQTDFNQLAADALWQCFQPGYQGWIGLPAVALEELYQPREVLAHLQGRRLASETRQPTDDFVMVLKFDIPTGRLFGASLAIFVGGLENTHAHGCLSLLFRPLANSKV
jgi:hypothetical protein